MLYNPMYDYTAEGRALLNAAKYIEEHGHCKGKLSDAQGRVCLIGAINMSVLGVDSLFYYSNIHGKDHNVKTVLKCFEILRGKLGDTNAGIVHWNNQPERTAEEAINMLKTCAEEHKITV
jgi:hypothetical protein